MEPMCDTLTVLKIDNEIFPANLELIVNQVLRLKSLELGYKSKDLYKAKLNSNSNITELKINISVTKIKCLLL
jgi:hypothetical protein